LKKTLSFLTRLMEKKRRVMIPMWTKHIEEKGGTLGSVLWKEGQERRRVSTQEKRWFKIRNPFRGDAKKQITGGCRRGGRN